MTTTETERMEAAIRYFDRLKDERKYRDIEDDAARIVGGAAIARQKMARLRRMAGYGLYVGAAASASGLFLYLGLSDADPAFRFLMISAAALIAASATCLLWVAVEK